MTRTTLNCVHDSENTVKPVTCTIIPTSGNGAAAPDTTVPLPNKSEETVISSAIQRLKEQNATRKAAAANDFSEEEAALPTVKAEGPRRFRGGKQYGRTQRKRKQSKRQLRKN